MFCNCEKYLHLELYREAIDKRIKETKKIKQQLEKISDQQDESFILWKCPICGQFWQSTYAWSWGAKDYVYKIPQISVEDWHEQTFIKPDELLIYSAVLSQFEEKQSFTEKQEKCIKENCQKNAIQFSVFCKTHHIESLQNRNVLPKCPKGRMFEPYS